MPTVLHRLNQWAKEAPQATAHRYKVGSQWREYSSRELMDRIYHLALFLRSRGIGSEDVGAIFSYNSSAWIQAELAVLLLGAKSAGLYPNSTREDVHYILNHTEATVLSVQNKEYFLKMTGPHGEAPIPERVKVLLVFDGDTSVSPKAVAFESAIGEGKKLASDPASPPLEKLLKELDPQAGAFMIYTSGTTGKPKGAMLSHDNLTYTSDLVSKYWRLEKGDGSTFSFLPLCHVAEKIQNVGVALCLNYSVSFCSKFEQVSVELPEVQPSLLLCVPRLWEKMMEGVQYKLGKAPPTKQKLAAWAFGLGARVSEARFSGKTANPLDLLQLKIADKLVLSKVRQALGLGRATVCASGAAALGAHITKWFRSLGVEICEDFGQTESTGCICMTERGKDCSGTVGLPLPGTEFKLAEDGEILTKGRHVFVGYFKDPDSTKATLRDGWLLTGDLGERDERGYIKIKGRKKEVLKTSGGKMVAPLPIEERIKAANIISQVCMVGDGRKFLSAIVTLTESTLGELKKTGKVNGAIEITDPAVLKDVKSVIENINQTLASYEQIKQFKVLSREFSIEDGEMTPTLKMKRNVIEKTFRDLIDQMYA